MQTTTATDRLIDFREVANIVGVGKSSLYELIHAGHLRPVKLGRKTVFAASEVNGFIQSRLANRATPLKLRTTKPHENAARGR